MINYNAMPEMSKKEIARLGNETITYFDDAVSGYVITKGSIEYFIELIAQENNVQAVKDMVYACGEMTVHTEGYGIVTIKLMGR